MDTEWLRPPVAKQPAPEVASRGRAPRAGGRWRRAAARSRRSRRGGPRGHGPRVRGTYRCAGTERGGGRRGRGGRGSEPLCSSPCPDPAGGDDYQGLPGTRFAGWRAWTPVPEPRAPGAGSLSHAPCAKQLCGISFCGAVWLIPIDAACLLQSCYGQCRVSCRLKSDLKITHVGLFSWMRFQI